MNTYNMDKMYESYADTVERMQMWLDESERENKKYKEAIEKIKTRYCDYYGTTKEVNDNYVLRSVLKEILEILKEVE